MRNEYSDMHGQEIGIVNELAKGMGIGSVKDGYGRSVYGRLERKWV